MLNPGGDGSVDWGLSQMRPPAKQDRQGRIKGVGIAEISLASPVASHVKDKTNTLSQETAKVSL